MKIFLQVSENTKSGNPPIFSIDTRKSASQDGMDKALLRLSLGEQLEFISIETIQDLAQQYGYWAIFWGILLENVGLPIPGETVTIVGGFLAGSDKLKYSLVLTDAIFGATIGGHIGYWIGRLGGYPLLLNVGKLLRFKESQIADLRDQFTQNDAKAVFIGRFIALLRVFASPLAGIAAMPYLKFTIYNTLGAIAWATTMVSLAFFAGELIPLEQLIKLASQFSLVALSLVALAIGVPIYLENRKAHQPESTAPVVPPVPAPAAAEE